MTVLPGDPARVALGVNATEEAVAATRAEFGTDRPLVIQYLDWVSGLPSGDFGRSYVTDVDIGPQVVDRLLVTTWLVLSGMAVAAGGGLSPAGVAPGGGPGGARPPA